MLMLRLIRCTIAILALWGAATTHAVQLAYEPVGLAWTAEEVDRVGIAQTHALVARAKLANQLGCRLHCERLGRVFASLIVQAREQTLRSAALPWSLLVVRLPDVNAMAMPNGQVVISETFVSQHLQSDDALAFVLAHEMAHSILEHERQALTYAKLLLPRQIVRSVRDMYTEMDFDLALVMNMEPVMHQGEYEADELGMLLASAAGYDPERQLAFAQAQCRTHAASTSLASSHPPACQRLKALQALLPLARRQQPERAN
jgi:predicted Zn-dependent protease